MPVKSAGQSFLYEKELMVTAYPVKKKELAKQVTENGQNTVRF